MNSSRTHLDAWRAVVTSHAAVTERVQRALAARRPAAAQWFEVLSAVKLSPTGSPRMSDLAEWLTLSRGGSPSSSIASRPGLPGAGHLRDDRRSFHPS